ncbi:MAG: hypothetical protein II691_08290, partial [Muribaculaceae bacterium]|nr:hypothetical protein [Muribaculaceae bacterium]
DRNRTEKGGSRRAASGTAQASCHRPECLFQARILGTATYIAQNEKRLQELLAFISVQQKELLYAIAREGVATKLTSAAFVKRHQLKSASAVQSAAKRLLDYDIITQKGHEFSVSDPLLEIWIRERMA